MKAILLLFLCASATLALVQIPVEQHTVHKDVLKAQQVKRLAKLGFKPMLPKPVAKKQGQKLIQDTFITDYISVNVSFGTPAQHFTVLLTSGSPRAWLLNKENKHILPSSIHTYKPDQSSTSKNLTTRFEQSDGSFDALGTFFSDTFQIGDVKIENQAFGFVRNYYDVNGADFPVDGVLGLNHLAKSVYTSKKEPLAPVDNLLKALSHKDVVFYLDKQRPPSQGPATGLITIGGVDVEHCDYAAASQSLALSPAKDDNRLIFNVSELKYGDKKVGVEGSVFIDISVSNILVPADALQNLINVIQPDYSYELATFIVPCNSTLQPLNFTQKNGAFIHVAAEDLIVDIDLNNGLCALAIDFDWDAPTYNEDYILGAPVARTSCLSYDFNIDVINVHPVKEKDTIYSLVKHRVIQYYNNVKDWIKKINPWK